MSLTHPAPPVFDDRADDLGDEAAADARESAARRRRNLRFLDELVAFNMQAARDAGARAAQAANAAPGANPGADLGDEHGGDEHGGDEHGEDGALPAPPDPPPNADAFADLLRATRVVRGLIALQHAIETRQPPPQPAPRSWSGNERVRRLLDWAMRQMPENDALAEARQTYVAGLACRTEETELPRTMTIRLLERIVRELPEDLVDGLEALEEAWDAAPVLERRHGMAGPVPP